MISVEKLLFSSVATGSVIRGCMPSFQYSTVTFPGAPIEPSIWKMRLLLSSIDAVILLALPGLAAALTEAGPVQARPVDRTINKKIIKLARKWIFLNG